MPEYWKDAIIVPYTKRKVGRVNAKHHSGIHFVKPAWESV